MRIWDLNPGYLNKQSLVDEHRELHDIVSIIKNNKKGGPKHSEALRWNNFTWALKQRHNLLNAEMNLRGYKDKSPVYIRKNKGEWPNHFIDQPVQQIKILKEKYQKQESGRIPLPINAQAIWAHHKYSVMARDIATYKSIGKYVTSKSGSQDVEKVALELTILLREPPEKRLIENALMHMWGYVKQASQLSNKQFHALSNQSLLKKIQKLSCKHSVKYLMHSTSLSELDAWSI